MSTLKQFLLTGRLDDLVCGDDEATLLERLGEADRKSVSSNPIILVYGDLELAFFKPKSEANARLKMIEIHVDRGDGLPRQLTIEGWWPTGEETVDEFRDWLTVNEIPIHRTVQSPPQIYLVLTSGARVTFHDNQLVGFSWTARGKTQSKQLAISVSRDEYSYLQRIAKDSHISVPAMCSRWIAQQLAEIHRVESRG